MTQEKTNGGYGQEQSDGEKNGSKGLADEFIKKFKELDEK